MTRSIPALYYIFGPTLTHSPFYRENIINTKAIGDRGRLETGDSHFIVSCAFGSGYPGTPPTMCGRELPSILKRLTFSEGHSSVTLQWSALPRSCFEDISLRRPWAYNIFMARTGRLFHFCPCQKRLFRLYYSLFFP